MRQGAGKAMLLVLLLCLHEILSKNAFLRSPQGFSLKADAKVGTFRATAKYFRGFFRKTAKVFAFVDISQSKGTK